MSEVRCQRTEGQEKDEHRTPARLASESVAGRSNVQHRTSNEKNGGRKAEVRYQVSGLRNKGSKFKVQKAMTNNQ